MFKTISSTWTAALSAHGSGLVVDGFSKLPKPRIGSILLDGASTGIVDEPARTGYDVEASGAI